MKSPIVKYNEIKEGWTNLLTTKDPHIIKQAEHRATICSNCVKNIFNVCIMCGCPLSAKTYSTFSNCDLNKW